MAQMAEKSVRVSGSAEGVGEVARAFDSFSSSNGLPGPLVRAVHVALDELLSNTVRSGFAPGQSGRIDVRFEIAEGALNVLIVDDGIPFDPLARADPDTAATLEARPVGGLGIYLVRQLVDKVDYERRGRENRLHLKKQIIGV